MQVALLEEELTRIRSKNLYRRLKTLTYQDSTHALWEDKPLTLFCGNDYLGLTRHPKVLEAAKQAVDQYGIGAGAARLISGTTEIHSELETKIAQIKGKEKALVYSAGYLANVGTLTALAEEDDFILMDKLCHASLIDGAMLSGARMRTFPHKNYARCEEILKKAPPAKQIILVTESVFSMDGDLADLGELVRLKEKYGAILLVDDAHGTGVLGKTGYGALEDLPERDKIDVVTGTLSKAFGCLGGFVASSEKIIDYLVNKSRPFIFATALPAVLCSAVLESIKVLEQDRELKEKLWKNVQLAQEAIQASGFALNEAASPILPVMIGDEKAALALSEKLLEEGIFIPAIRTPTVPKGKARLRVTVSAAHSAEDLGNLKQTLQKSKQ